LFEVVTDGGNYEGPMFAVSWLLTMFSHDIEKFQNLQRLFDVVIANGPDFIPLMIQTTIKQNKGALFDYVKETDDRATAPFVVFRTPMRCFNSADRLE